MESLTARTSVLDIAYEAHGPATGPVVILLHGFPYDPRCYDEVAPPLAADGCRVLVPYLRGYGPTRFLSDKTPRSGEQAALGHDLLQLMDVLGIRRAMLAGFDWGGRAACVLSALWPERARGLVSCTGYNIQDIKGAATPVAPAQEHRYWYQYYLHTERGRAGLAANRRAFAKQLWELWSPNWHFADQTFDRSAPSFDNPDFVDVVVQSYRHRYGYAAGDPALLDLEARLQAQPKITVPAINLDGDGDGIRPISHTEDPQAKHFTGPYERRVIPRVGHNIPQEAPADTVRAIRDLLKTTSGLPGDPARPAGQ
jgi:pimeloyl-ACP methyl ester carboxylesterase